ncbi:carboxypeptidase-like regulatory domain-containing protein [Ulvibacterium sp.]|uniref:TonB-dependent receptor n=1 Tax=Ulvibacterium sp. TaxID=2665914 RepID=UPI00262CE56E|nr:carboxypeptidase-like regulatory domain-containing protein [Ulvibacterium sp.]
MLKTHPKRLIFFFTSLLFLVFAQNGSAQDGTDKTALLISYLQILEQRFEVKFSYVDEDIRNLQITVPETSELQKILSDIQAQTQLKIQQLSERYYTLNKSSTVDVCATVLDNFKQNTVTGATVKVLDSEIALITDMNGSFSLTNVPRKAVLEIKHLGFKTLFVKAEELIDANPCKTLLLAQFYQQLDEVIVYQFLTTGILKEADGSIQMNTAEFGILPGLLEPDILQTVQALPGIKSIDETVSDINIRGGTNDQNLMLWDGIKMYQSGHFFGLISAFNPYLTDRIILIKNGTSAQYGDGVSGVLDMRTKNEVPDSFTGGGGLNLIGGDLYGQLPISDKLGFQFSARRSLTDFLETPTYGQFVNRVFQDTRVTQNSDFYFYDFTGKLLYDINPYQKVRLSFININNRLDYQETNTDSFRSSQSTLDQTNISFGGSLESQWTDRFSSHLNLYYTNYDLDAENSTANGQQILFQNNEVIETALKLNTHLRINEDMNWLNGYQLTETGIRNIADVSQPPFRSNVKGVIRAHSLFSEIEYKSTDTKLMARGGARLNYIRDLETFDSFEKVIIEPRLNINYTLAKHFKAELLGEFKSQATNQVIDLEQNFLGIEKRRWILSDNDSLPITRSKQASIGFNYDHPKLYVGIEGFYKEVKGISTETQGFQNQNQFDGEIGQYEVKGIEFLINKKTIDYSAWLSYTYNVNTYTFPEINPSEFPNNLDIRHTFTFAGTYTYQDFKFGIGLNYRTGRPFTEPDPDNPIDTTFFPNRINFQEPNSSRLPEYLRADASAVYEFDLSRGIKASLGASVLNFTDRRNILNTYYRISDSGEVEAIENVSLGITPNFSLRVRF